MRSPVAENADADGSGHPADRRLYHESRGHAAEARLPFLFSLALFVFFAAPFLPVYTPARARVYRVVKWVTMLALFGLMFGADTLKYSWLVATCLWVPFWTESTRMSIRRKLPVAQWPKQLYL